MFEKQDVKVLSGLPQRYPGMFHIVLYSLLPLTGAISIHRLGVHNHDKYQLTFILWTNPRNSRQLLLQHSNLKEVHVFHRSLKTKILSIQMSKPAKRKFIFAILHMRKSNFKILEVFLRQEEKHILDPRSVNPTSISLMG